MKISPMLPHFFEMPYNQLPSRANVSLWYEKYCFTWDIDKVYDRQGNVTDWKKLKNSSSYKTDWIDTVTGGKVGDQKLLTEAEKRIITLTENMHGKTVYMKSTSRFVTGIGQAHYVENGFAFHHTLGVPYLPGSSVKGMVKAWATEWAEKKDVQTIQRIFGPETGEAREVGKILFLDAFPIRPVKLEKEIITPHYGPYYGDLGRIMDGKPVPSKKDPLDSGFVKPIPFLTMAKEQTFLFAFMPRENYPQRQNDLELVRGWLIYALQWMGAGAKTASGYGRFMQDLQPNRLKE